MQKIIRLSRLLQWLCRALIVLSLISLIFFWSVVTPIHQNPDSLFNSAEIRAATTAADYIPGIDYIPGMLMWGTEMDLHNPNTTAKGEFNLKLRFAPSGPTQKLAFWQRLSAGFLSALSLSFTLLILFYLSQLFGWYCQGDIFSKRHVLCFKRIALTLIAAQLCRPLLDGGIGLILTWFNPMGRIITVSFDNSNIVALFSSSIILLIALIMQEGYKIHQEIQLTV